MPKYRAPSEILWVNDGWQECEADTVDGALTYFRIKGMNITFSNIQIQNGNTWKFASEVPSYLGGYKN